MELIGHPELIGAPGYSSNPERVANVRELDRLIGEWSGKLAAEKIIALLDDADIPSCKTYDASDCANDAQYRARGMVREVADPRFGAVLHAGMVPHVPRSEEHTSESSH